MTQLNTSILLGFQGHYQIITLSRLIIQIKYKSARAYVIGRQHSLALHLPGMNIKKDVDFMNILKIKWAKEIKTHGYGIQRIKV